MRTVDQATRLRRLVSRAAGEGPAVDSAPTRLVVIGGAQFGVGATTLAVNVSVAMAARGTGCVLVDADWYQSDVAAYCGLIAQADVTDVLAARRDVHEVLHPGPGGIWVVPGFRVGGNRAECRESSQSRLLRQLRALGGRAEVVVVDVGNGTHDFARCLWDEADLILLAVNGDIQSLMEGYASIKRATGGRSDRAIHLVANRVANRRRGEEVYRRIDSSCRRFLGFSLGYLAQIPEDSAVSAGGAIGKPCVLQSPAGAAADAFESLAERLSEGAVWAADAAGTAGARWTGQKPKKRIALSPGSAVIGR